MSKTNVDDFIGELGAGVFKDALAHILSGAAMGTVLHGNGKKGKVTLDFAIEQVGDNDQVMVTHKMSHSIPTKRGKKMEETTTTTSFFVGKGGAMTINAPEENQGGQTNAALVLSIQKDGERKRR